MISKVDNKVYPLLIIGSGPAALTASIYACRAKIEHALICGPNRGGQLVTSPEVENFPGVVLSSGFDIISSIEKHALSLGAKMINDTIERVDFNSETKVLFSKKHTYKANNVIIATGAQPAKLGLSNEESLTGRGISYCATCDGNFYRNKIVAVVGGGNAALEEAIYLANIAKSVILIHRRNSFKGEQILQDKVLSNTKISILWDTIIIGLNTKEDNLQSCKLKNTKTNVPSELSVSALFIAIGGNPCTEFLKNSPIELDKNGYIITKPSSTATNVDGVFAAGDVSNPHLKQAIISAGSGATAALEAIRFLSLKS